MKPTTSRDSQSVGLESEKPGDSKKSMEPPDIYTEETTAPRKKRKYRFRARARSPTTVTRMKQVRRSKANDRERHRMHNFNDGLEMLREVLPIMPDDNKMTKSETLRMALNYMLSLEQLLKLPERELHKLRQTDIPNFQVRPSSGSYQMVPNTSDHSLMGYSPAKTLYGSVCQSLEQKPAPPYSLQDCSVPDIGMPIEPQYGGPSSLPLPPTVYSTTELVTANAFNREKTDRDSKIVSPYSSFHYRDQYSL